LCADASSVVNLVNFPGNRDSQLLARASALTAVWSRMFCRCVPVSLWLSGSFESRWDAGSAPSPLRHSLASSKISVKICCLWDRTQYILVHGRTTCLWSEGWSGHICVSKSYVEF